MHRPADTSPDGLKGEICLTNTSDQRPAKPSLALRVGITGARRLSTRQRSRIQVELGFVLNLVKQEMERLAQATLEASDFYAHDPEKAPEVILRMTSPLARGADRLAAQAALEAGYELYVPMPFAQAEYEKDFTGSDGKLPDEIVQSAEEDLAEFSSLMSKAAGSVALDGGRHCDEIDEDETLGPASYEAVGRFVVRHCDLLLAIWDGRPSNGRGGTAEIVQYAAESGVPVWWINAQQKADPVWITDVLDLPPRKPQSCRTRPKERLEAYLKGLILAPQIVPEHVHGVIEWLSSKVKRHPASSLADYFEPTEDARSSVERIFQWCVESSIEKLFLNVQPLVMKLAERGFTSRWITGPKSPEPTDPLARYWSSLYKPADKLALAFTNRYRCGYVLTIALTALAPLLGAIAVAFMVAAKGELGLYAYLGLLFAGVELVDLLAIIFLVVLSMGNRWHKRSIEYRLLAELHRQQQTLAPLGWALPVDNVQQISDDKQQSWVTWLFAASQRSAPMAVGTFACQEQRSSCREAVIALVNDQIRYHSRRQRRSRQAGHKFESWGGLVFLLVLLFVCTKVVFEVKEVLVNHLGRENLLREILEKTPRMGTSWMVALGLAAVVLPTISAAFVALRSYAELEMLTEQSRHMRSKLWRARSRVKRVQLERLLASQDLGAEALGVAAIMLNDLEGWGRLFRGKILEAS